MSSFREVRGALTPREFGVKRRHVLGGKENVGAVVGGNVVKKPKLATPVRPRNPAVSALQDKIDHEYKMRDGAVKLLQASKSTHQSMEASKGLFVSNAKIIALMSEMQQIQGDKKENKTGNEESKPCKSKIAISDIRIPLEWNEYESMRGKADQHGRLGVFCLFKMGNQVMDTPTLAFVDRSTVDISFRDLVIFPGKVDPDFTIEVEVYCSVPGEEPPSNKPSTPIKMLKRFRSKERVEDSPAHNSSVISSPYTPHIPPATPSHRFALAGYTQFSLKDVTGSSRTYTLHRGAVGSSGTASTSGGSDHLLPLWGQICCTLMAQPDCATDIRITGFINTQRMIGGLPDWQRLWCVMRQEHIRCWNYPEDVGRKMPAHSIDLTECMEVENASRLSIRRPNTLIVRDGRRQSESFLAFGSREEKDQWMGAINQALLDLRAWKSSSGYMIPVPSSKFYTDSPSKEFEDIPQMRDTKSKKTRPSSCLVHSSTGTVI